VLVKKLARACGISWSVQGWAWVQVACRLESSQTLPSTIHSSCPGRAFWKEAIVASLGVLAQEPAIAKVVIALDQLNAIPAPQAELVGTAGQELVCGCVLAERASCLRHMAGSYGRRRGYRRVYNSRCAMAACLQWGTGGGTGRLQQRLRGAMGARLYRQQSPRHKAVVVHFIMSCCGCALWLWRVQRAAGLTRTSSRGLPRAPLCEKQRLRGRLDKRSEGGDEG
jgi:hypothetical protein